MLMGKWKETEEAYYMDEENKVIGENNCCTGLVQSLDKLHKMRDIAEQLGLNEYVDAFNVVFRWIDEMVLLLKKIGEIKI